jgi:hypothetical protein
MQAEFKAQSQAMQVQAENARAALDSLSQQQAKLWSNVHQAVVAVELRSQLIASWIDCPPAPPPAAATDADALVDAHADADADITTSTTTDTTGTTSIPLANTASAESPASSAGLLHLLLEHLSQSAKVRLCSDAKQQ